MDKNNYTGWYDNGYFELYCENGLVIRGKTKGKDARTVYPYKRDNRGEWDKGTPKLTTFLRSAAWQMK